MRLQAIKVHPSNKAKNQIIDWLRVYSEPELITYNCVDGHIRSVSNQIIGCDIEKYKQLNNIK